MSTYLVTGVAGFIASKVAEFLLAEGHTVVGVDNLNDYYDVRLKDYRLAQLLGVEPKAESGKLKAEGPTSDPVFHASSQLSAFSFQLSPLKSTNGRFAFYHLDIENLPALEEIFQTHKFDAVFNLAARAGVRYSLENPHVYLSTNTLGTLNILECQRKYGVKKQVLASTSSLYAGCPMPFTEDQPVNTPLSPYAATKKAAEMLTYTYHKLYGLDITVVRYFTVFGPAGRPDMAPFRFIKWIDEGTPITLFGDGNQTRDFTYVDDIARGTILAGQLFGGKLAQPKASAVAGPMADKESGRRLGAEGEAKLKAEVTETKSASGPESSAFSFQPSAFPVVAPSYDVINLGGGRNPISLHTVIGFIEKALADRGRRTEDGGQIKAKISGQPFHAADMKETWADITKAERLLGWTPEVSPEEGFLRTVAWHVANREWLNLINV